MEYNNEKEDNREFRATVRFTKKEWQAVCQWVHDSGLCTAKFLRRSILGVEIKRRLTEDEIIFLRQITGMANNLNQLTKAVHRNEDVLGDLKATLFTINWLVDKLK